MATITPTTRTNAKGKEVTKWQVHYTDADGFRRHPSYPTEKLAIAARKTIERQLDEGTHTAASVSPTVREACDLWIKIVKEDLKRTGSTWIGYRGMANRHIIPFLGDKKISQLRPQDVGVFFDALRKDKANPRPFALAKKAVAHLSMMLQAMMSAKPPQIAHNVAAAFKAVEDSETQGLRLRKEKKKLKTPTIEMAKAMLAAAEKLSTEGLTVDGVTYARQACAYPMIVLAAATGMRISEVRALRWDDVDLEGGWLSIEQSCDIMNDPGFCKTEAAYRDVPLSDPLVAMLTEWRLACPKDRVMPVPVGRGRKQTAMLNLNPLNLVFPNANGRKRTGESVKPMGYTFCRENIWQPVAIAAGLAHATGRTLKGRNRKGSTEERQIYAFTYGWHSLRHFMASLLVKSKVHDRKEIISLLGHATFDITDRRYVHNMRDGGEQERAGQVTGVLFG